MRPLLLFFFSLLLDRDPILEKASTVGFYYRFVDISVTEKCPAKQLCLAYGNKLYLITKKDSFSLKEREQKDAITLEIVPDKNYVAYFLYIQYKSGVYKTKITKRKVVIKDNIQNIEKIQIVGTAASGPRVIWQKELLAQKSLSFANSFDESLKKLRLAYHLKPLLLNKELETAAQESLKKLKNEGLVHYSSKSGSVRHTQIKKRVIGENLFISESEAKAWKMLLSSPSHLYNMISPQFHYYFYAFSKEKNGVYGAILFSD